MRALFLAIAIGLVGWIDVSVGQQWDTIPHPDYESSVVKIKGSDGLQGSGVVVKKVKVSNSKGYYIGLILTASHCVSDMSILFDVEFFDGSKTLKNTVVRDLPIYADPDNDLAIIRALIPSDVVPVEISSINPDCGDEIMMSGYGTGSVRHWRAIYGGTKMKSGGHILFSWAIQGDSGGPVIHEGKVVGVICYGCGLKKYEDTKRMIVSPVNASNSLRIRDFVDSYEGSV